MGGRGGGCFIQSMTAHLDWEFHTCVLCTCTRCWSQRMKEDELRQKACFQGTHVISNREGHETTGRKREGGRERREEAKEGGGEKEERGKERKSALT